MNQKNELVKVEDILPDNLLEKVSKIAKIEIQKQKKQKMPDYIAKDDTFIDEGVKPLRDNYSVVWPEGENIIINFGQYQVGSYAEGIYEVKIPPLFQSVKFIL